MSIEEEIKSQPFPLPGCPIVVSYGGGTNSTALIIALHLKGIRPDAIVFADTGNEHPRTYQFLERFDKWLESVGFPCIEVVRYRMKSARSLSAIAQTSLLNSFHGSDLWTFHLGMQIFSQEYKYSSLGEECLVLESLPSKAYGSGKCSAKWKVEVIHKFIKQRFEGKKAVSCVGIHAGEKQRLLFRDGSPKLLKADFGWNHYPLIRWDLAQENCDALCRWALGEVPPKSSCWFCPNAKPSEVEDLKRSYPEYYKLGCFIEERGQRLARSPLPLGRSFWWRDVGRMSEIEQLQAEFKAASRKCGCTD